MIGDGNNYDKNDENDNNVVHSVISGQLQVTNMYVENYNDAFFYGKSKRNK